jgi:hypothetical protein
MIFNVGAKTTIFYNTGINKFDKIFSFYCYLNMFISVMK